MSDAASNQPIPIRPEPLRPEDLFGLAPFGTPSDGLRKTITPAVADAILERFNTANRPAAGRRDLSPEDYEAMIRAGLFETTHQGIAFDANGVLVDGQTRLEGIRKAGLPVTMQVTFGLKVGAFRFVDRMRRRTLGHNLHAEGTLRGPAATFLEAAGRIVANIDAGRLPWNHSHRFEQPDLDGTLARHPGLPEAVTECYHNRGKPALPTGQTAAYRALFAEAKPDLSLGFWEGIRTGARLDADDSRHVLRLSLVGGFIKADKAQAYQTRLVRAWNHHVGGTRTSKLSPKLRDGRFPEIAGYRRPVGR